MIETLKNAWKITELRKKIIFTLFILMIYRVGNVIPVPYIDVTTLASYFDSVLSTTILGLYNAMSGSAFSQATVFALGIQPYINSSIIIQLLTIAIPALERLAKEGGEEGKKKINAITRYATVGIAVLSAFGYYTLMKNYGLLTANASGIWPALVIIVSFVAGSSFVMWMGEQINEFGIGNGISMILFAGIVSRVPTAVSNMISSLKTWSSVNKGVTTLDALVGAGYSEQQAQNVLNGAIAPWGLALMLIGALALVFFIVFIQDAERRIPVQYAKRQVGRKMYGGQSSNLPMKVNMAGVLPVIFAQSIVSIPATVMALMGVGAEEGTFSYALSKFLDSKSIAYMVLYALLIIGFSYFYSSIQFNPVEIANNLKKQGGFIPGFRPGKPTVDFIKKVLNKITLFGAIYLGIVAILPLFLGKLAGSSSMSIGGTSIIIVVGVALETVKALDAQMLMRQYKGFLE